MKAKDGIKTWPFRFLKGYFRDVFRYTNINETEWKQHFHQQVPYHIMKAVLMGKKNVQILVINHLKHLSLMLHAHSFFSKVHVMTDNEDDDETTADEKVDELSGNLLPCFTCFLQSANYANLGGTIPCFCRCMDDVRIISKAAKHHIQVEARSILPISG